MIDTEGYDWSYYLPGMIDTEGYDWSYYLPGMIDTEGYDWWMVRYIGKWCTGNSFVKPSVLQYIIFCCCYYDNCKVNTDLILYRIMAVLMVETEFNLKIFH